MKTGALLLTFTSVACNNSNQVTCYETVATNSIWLDGQTQNGIVLDLDTSQSITGSINAVQGADFSFSLFNGSDKKVQTGQLLPVDGKFDAFNEKFKIEIDKNTLPGVYHLKVYSSTVAAQDTTPPNIQSQVEIKSGN